jgi:hypothetical protein
MEIIEDSDKMAVLCGGIPYPFKTVATIIETDPKVAYTSSKDMIINHVQKLIQANPPFINQSIVSKLIRIPLDMDMEVDIDMVKDADRTLTQEQYLLPQQMRMTKALASIPWENMRQSARRDHLVLFHHLTSSRTTTSVTAAENENVPKITL